MESALLGVVLDSSIVITAERKKLPVPHLIETILNRYGEVEVSLSPVTVAELVHGIYRATRLMQASGGESTSRNS